MKAINYIKLFVFFTSINKNIINSRHTRETISATLFGMEGTNKYYLFFAVKTKFKRVTNIYTVVT